MSKTELYKQVMALPPAEKQRMLDKLRASLSDDIPPQLTSAERKELLRKAAAFRKNPKSFIPWEKAKAVLSKHRAERSR